MEGRVKREMKEGGMEGGGMCGEREEGESYLVPSADRPVPEPGAFDRSAECTPTQRHWCGLCRLCMRTQ